MHLKVAAIGQRMPSWVNDGWCEYARRMPRNLALEMREIPMERRGNNADIHQLKEKEGQKLLSVVPDSAVAVALDEHGEPWSTTDLSTKLSSWMAGGKDVWFLVGGPDGLDRAVLDRADQRWSLGPLTLPHPLVRIVLSEQLYRAWSIVAGHPYHRP